jgi:hypothetical protein
MPMMAPQHAEDVREKLAEHEPVDQEEFVEEISRSEGFRQEEVLDGLRNLMERDQISYTIEWDLQIEE